MVSPRPDEPALLAGNLDEPAYLAGAGPPTRSGRRHCGLRLGLRPNAGALVVIAGDPLVGAANGAAARLRWRPLPPLSPDKIEPQPPAKAGAHLTPYRSFNNGSRN